MQVTKQHIDWLTSMWVSKEIIDTAQAELDLQNARSEAGRLVFAMNEVFQEEMRKGSYDDILGDINAMIDRTQELMQKEAEEI